MRKFPVLFLLLLAIAVSGYGQFYEYGQDDGRLKWNSFEAPHYRLIYPRGMDSLAFIIADRLEYYYTWQAEELGHRQRPLPVILHNESSFSNGVVSWAPRRLEVFTNPDPNGYPQDWLTQLVLHEGRHAFQIDKVNQGFTRGLSFLAGEQAVGAVAAYLPRWYLEGDAVEAETRFSYTGRGRLPSFEMENRAILLSRQKPYNFNKAILGSYRDYVPDHYQTGYLLVDYARRSYGDQFWPDMVTMAARYPFSVSPAHFSFRKYGEKNKQMLYYRAMNEYFGKWQDQAKQNDTDTLIIPGHEKKKAYTQYTFPHYINDSVLFLLKTGMDQIPEFISLDTQGREERLYRPGYLNSGRVSVAGGKVVWDEFIPDLRWSNLNYSVVKVLDLESGEVKALGRKTRLYSPAVSGSGTMVASVEQSENYTFALVVTDLNGESLFYAPAPGNHYIQQPCWMEKDSAVAMTMVKDDGEHIVYFGLKDRSWHDLYANGYEDISWPVVRDGYVWYSSTNSGIDDIYRLQLATGKAERITRSVFGATQPQLSPDDRTLVYADYTMLGYEPAMKSEEMLRPQALEEVRKPELSLSREVTPESKQIIEGESDIPEGTYTPRKFSKTGHLINIHSWLPVYLNYLDPALTSNPESLPVSPGFTLVSQNLLSTAVSTLGYEYKGGFHYLHAGVVLKGRYPVVEIGMDYGGEPYIQQVDNTQPPLVSPNDFSFNLSSYIPFRFNTGRFITLLQPSLSWIYKSSYYYYPSSSVYIRGMQYFHSQVYFASYLRRGQRDIMPRLGLVLIGQNLSTPFEDELYGNAAALSMAMYLPGALAHHSLKGSLAYQHQEFKNFGYNNLMSLPRGMDFVLAENLLRLSADYIFPVAYPDLSLDFLGYIPRIRGAVWVDYMQGNNVYRSDYSDQHTQTAEYLTLGADLIFDYHVLRIAYPVSIGARFEYLRESSKFKVEMLFSVDLP